MNYYYDLPLLNYSKFVEKGEKRISKYEDYNSHNTKRLDENGLKRILMKLDFIKAAHKG